MPTIRGGVRGRPPPCRRLPELGGPRGDVRGDAGGSCSTPPCSNGSARSVCDAVTGRPGSVRMLHELERSNAFLIPLDTRREWYSYHHLFRELLRHELAIDDPERARDLHRRASAWHRDHGRPVRGDPPRHCGRRDRGRDRADPAPLDRFPERRAPRDPARLGRRTPARQRVGRSATVPGAGRPRCRRWAGSPRRSSGWPRPPEARTTTLAPGRPGLAGLRGRRVTGDQPLLPRRRARDGRDGPSGAPTRGGRIRLLAQRAPHHVRRRRVPQRRRRRPPRALLDDAVTASERSHHSLALVHALGWCALVHAELGEPDRADQALADADALQRREPGLANYFGMSMTHVARGELLQRQGRLERSRRSADPRRRAGSTRQREVRPVLRPAHPRRGEGPARRS